VVTRHVFVGDIQGCREELERLLEAVRFDPAADVLEPTGDLVNRGPDSLGTLRLLKSLGAQGVLGNHDVRLLQVAAGQRLPAPKDTFADVLGAEDRRELLAWLGARPVLRETGGMLLVHAGLHPAWRDPVATLQGADPLSDDWRVGYAVSVRHCAPDGSRPTRDDPPPGPPYRPWFDYWVGRAHPTIVFGHWAALGLVERPGFRGLDTGCVWGGRLTAWIAEEDRLVHVPSARAYSAVRR
jgi:bis(5'-nucleosyl)-tetraphosphatase (symmetrical)